MWYSALPPCRPDTEPSTWQEAVGKRPYPDESEPSPEFSELGVRRKRQTCVLVKLRYEERAQGTFESSSSENMKLAFQQR